MATDSKVLGMHLILELVGCKKHGTKDQIETILVQAAEDTGATVLFTHLHPFEGGGITGVVVLAESHLTIHTWPELNYAAVDVFVCGKCDPVAAIPTLHNWFQAKDIFYGLYERGIPEIKN